MPLLQAKKLLGEHGVDAALLIALPDVRWACGFTGSNGLLLVAPDAAHFVSDSRYAEQARRQVQGATVHTPGYALMKYVAREDLLSGAQRVLFQADHVTIADLEDWRGLFPDVEWVAGRRLLTHQRAMKTEEEIVRMRRAQALTDAVFAEVLDLLRPGVTEKEAAAEIVYRLLRHGAERLAFDPIVASGPRGALPHARPTDSPLAFGDLVVLDFGCVVGGYASDMTRTVALGEPGEDARRVYAVVRDAQQKALDAARSGITAKALDQAARSVIEAAGYGDAFGHSLGHGIGLETHEWPRVSSDVDHELPAGAVLTIEPGVYLAGRFGVRIEDMIVLREGGCEILTASPKELIVL